MLRSLAVYGVLGLVMVGLVVWAAGFVPSGDPAGPPDDPARPAQAPKTAPGIGQLLAADRVAAAPVQPEVLPANRPASLAPLVISEARIGVIDKEDVPALQDGPLLVIGTELAEGEQLAPGVEMVEVEFANTTKLRYRRLKEGDVVKKNQLLAIVDPSLSLHELEIKKAKLVGAKADAEASLKTRDESEERYRTAYRLSRSGSNVESIENVRAAKLTWDRYYFEEISKRYAIETALREMNQAETTLKMYELRSAIPGVVKTIYKNRGDAVKKLDPVFQIENYDRIRFEGRVEVPYLAYLEKGKTQVVVEPTRPERPLQVLPGHLGEVTSVAVTNDVNNPEVVSGSTDTSVIIWDRMARRARRILTHSAAVNAVACTPPGAEHNYVLAGAANGTARLWDLAKDADQPLWQSSESDSHKRAINCVAFNLDGKTCATGGEDGVIALWDTANGQQLYRFPNGHRGGITSIQFVPGGKLVSAGRDYALMVWSVGQQGARLEMTRNGRTGQVTALGASPDGKVVLFDQGKQLHLLSLQDGRPEGSVQNSVSGSPNFTTMAEFSPDGKLILAAGAPGGGVQLWRAPTAENRAYEMRQLVWTGSPATCGAFAPNGSFVVTGTKDRWVLVWPVPAKEEFEQPLKATVTFVDQSADSGRQVRVWAEMDNKAKLIPGTTATLVVNPQSK